MTESPQARLPLQSLPIPGRWLLLLAGSVLAGGALQALELPAAIMLGPLAAAMALQAAGGAVKVPRGMLASAQAVIGCLVARAITPTVLHDFVAGWPVFVAAVTLTLAGAVAIGWAMSRLRIIPGTTAVWGMLPGAATAMLVMAEAYGADFRLVAFMQYLRVVLVTAMASVVAALFTHGGISRFAAGIFPPVDVHNLALTAALGITGAVVGLRSRMPAGVLIGPIVFGGLFNALGLVTIELPPVVLIASYAIIGWNVGLRFTREVLAAAARALPQSLAATALLMALCGLIAWALVEVLHVDPMTAYLATSPGGLDASAVIAASMHVDMPFVMVLQSLRLITVIAIGPRIARLVADTLKHPPPSPAPPEPLDLGELD